MKKFLLSTTALAAVSAVSLAASPASAQSLEERVRTLEESMLMGMPGAGFDVTVSGYMTLGMFLTNADNDTDGNSNTGTNGSEVDHGATNMNSAGGEIHFTATSVLDNGMTVGARVELEDKQDNDQIDESYIWAEGGFGRINVGSENGAAYLMHYSAPWFGLNGIDSPNFRHSSYNGATTWAAVRTATQTLISSDARKLTYFTPRFSGFQFGISYTPDNGNRSGEGGGLRDREDGNVHDIIDVAANFTRDLGGFTAGVSAGYETGAVDMKGNTPVKDDPVNWHIGGNVGAQGFSLGASWYTAEGFAGAAGTAHRWACGSKFAGGEAPTGNCQGEDGNAADDDNAAPVVDLSDKIEQTAWAIGAKYATGPWSFSAAYFEAEGENYPGLTRVVETEDGTGDLYIVEGKRKPQTSVIGFGATYDLGPGVTLGADLAFYEDEDGIPGRGSVESTAGGLLLGVSF